MMQFSFCSVSIPLEDSLIEGNIMSKDDTRFLCVLALSSIAQVDTLLSLEVKLLSLIFCHMQVFSTSKYFQVLDMQGFLQYTMTTVHILYRGQAVVFLVYTTLQACL